jgi:hypothetical protein
VPPSLLNASKALIQYRYECKEKYEQAADQNLFGFVAHVTNSRRAIGAHFIPRAGRESMAIGNEGLAVTALHPVSRYRYLKPCRARASG